MTNNSYSGICDSTFYKVIYISIFFRVRQFCSLGQLNMAIVCHFIVIISVLIQTISGSLDFYLQLSSLSCRQVITDSAVVTLQDRTIVKNSGKFINISRNETFLEKTLPNSRACLIYIINPSFKTQSWLAGLKRHLIIIEGANCEKTKASEFNVDLYCIS